MQQVVILVVWDDYNIVGDYFYPDELSVPERALLFNLYNNEGAISWARGEVANMPGSTHDVDNGWDISYKTYDFDYMEAASVNPNGKPCLPPALPPLRFLCQHENLA